MITDEGRNCTKCGDFKPWSAFSKNRQDKVTGYRPQCKDCTSKAVRNKTESKNSKLLCCWICNRDKPSRDFSGIKPGGGKQFFCKECHSSRLSEIEIYFPTSACSKCQSTKKRQEFAVCKKAFNGLFCWCRECVIKAKREDRKLNKDKINESYRRNYAKNPQPIRDRNKVHRQKTRAVQRAYRQKRRALLKSAISDEGLTVDSLRLVFGDACYFCGIKMEFTGWEVSNPNLKYATHEHLIPLTRGGQNTFDNSVLACYRCNCRKHNKTEEEFIKVLEKEV